MKNMHAIGFTQSLSVDHQRSLFDFTTEKPTPKGHDILVAVEAVGVNPIDTKQRLVSAREAALEQPKILGWDAAGTVIAIGELVTEFVPGDAVYYAGDVTRPGSNAQFQLVDARIVGRKPKTVSFAQAAALPLTSITAWEALFERFGCQARDAGKTILIINGGGGVGSIAIQLARYVGLSVIATASRPETTSWCRQMGAQYLISHKQPIAPQLQTIGVQQCDYILSCVAPDAYLVQMAEVIAPQGKICAIVDNQAPLDLKCLKPKSASFCWEFMFTKTMFQTSDMGSQKVLLDTVADLIDDGVIQSTLKSADTPICARTLKTAHATLEKGIGIGKTVLHGWQSKSNNG